ncbi:WYL domain-containing protein [Pseudomonas sp. xss_4]|uniref:WYL domain-containing protein n=1 Tax=Pseudomonas TaxID=286 RepID=UPI0018ABB1CB|nr:MULTISPECIES: WYL domain-containing protein [Pseudomonas]MBF8767609.1 WYL domain-containing protein [Pseudomonas putida]MBH3343079.1 WYL domain-containing protein [Pseudomonas parafulva]MEC4023633.1 WYL domain-containing protein [Pseudomonas fulva]
MPSRSSRHTIARQWELLKLLPGRHPGMSCTQLQAALSSAGHATTKRTVERDLVELAGLFPLQRNSACMPYSWHWQPGSKLRDGATTTPGEAPVHVELHAWVDESLYHHLEIHPLGTGMRLTVLPNGGAILVTTVADDRALMCWLLSQAGAIRVQGPQSVRLALLEHLRQSLALHDTGA